MEEIDYYLQNTNNEFTKEKFISEVIIQLNKDFPSHFTKIPLSFENQPKAVINQLQKNVKTLIIDHKENIKQVFYQIDLKENDINTAFSTGLQNSIEKLTKLIIKREAQKVYLRWRFKNQ